MVDKWECFRDSAYYDMWAVRNKDNKGFYHAIHVGTRDEAEFLVESLNELDRLRGK